MVSNIQLLFLQHNVKPQDDRSEVNDHATVRLASVPSDDSSKNITGTKRQLSNMKT